MSLTYNMSGSMKKFVRCFSTDMHGVTRLKDMEFLNYFEHNIRNLAGSIRAIGLNSTQINIRKIVVSSAFACSNPDFWRCRMIVHFYPETGDQFLSFISGKRSLGYLFIIKRCQVLVEMAWVHGIPAIQLGNCSQVNKPVHLYGFPKISGSIGRNPMAYFRNL